MNWDSYLSRPAEFAAAWLRQDLNNRQEEWLKKIGEADGRVGLVFHRHFTADMMQVLACAATWRGFVHKKHSQIVVSTGSVGREWLKALGFMLASAKPPVRDFFDYTDKGWLTRENIAVWCLASAHPNNLSAKIKNCDLYIGDFDLIPQDLLAKAFGAKLNGLLVFPTLSGKWPHHM